MLAGLIRDDEREVLEGIPGLSDLPVVGRLFAHTQKQGTQTDIILTLTPHVIRVLDLNEADLRPFKVGRDSLSPIGDVALPPPVTVPQPEPPAQQPPAQQPPAQQPQPQQPLSPQPPRPQDAQRPGA